MPVFIDIESYSAEPIKNGTFRYAENAEILMVAWTINDDLPDIEERFAAPLNQMRNRYTGL